MSETYTVKEVAAKLGVHAATVRRLIASGRLEATKVDRAFRVTGEALAAFFKREPTSLLVPWPTTRRRRGGK